MIIAIDTREQRPWHFPPDVATVRRETLHTGDYALYSDEGFAIERKSLDDFIGTLSSGWDRFIREIKRMESWPAKVIIVEGRFLEMVYWEDCDIIVAPKHSHFKCSPAFVMKRIAELTMLGVSVILAENPELASAMAYRILLEREVQIGARNDN